MGAYAVEQVIADVARARMHLESLDPNIDADRLARCSQAVADLESVTAAILFGRWIPADAQSLALSIRFLNDNIRAVRSRIDDVIPDVVARDQADEYLRLNVAFAQARLLELQREIVMQTLVQFMPEGTVN